MRDKGGLLIALPDTLTMADLCAAWQRRRVLHLRGWTFERALGVPVMVTTLMHSAEAHRARHQLPAQPRLL